MNLNINISCLLKLLNANSKLARILRLNFEMSLRFWHTSIDVASDVRCDKSVPLAEYKEGSHWHVCFCSLKRQKAEFFRGQLISIWSFWALLNDGPWTWISFWNCQKRSCPKKWCCHRPHSLEIDCNFKN